jgi:hypothetical protein
MGRQTQLHLLADDCREFLHFIQERDPVVVGEWHSSQSPEIADVNQPWDKPSTYCLWNQALLPSLQRNRTGRHFNVDSSLPVIQFSFTSPLPGLWNARPAITQGRIWASFETENDDFARWFNAIVRWIRKNFIRDQLLGLNMGFVGTAAYEWFKQGGLLLPSFHPPLTESWLAWADVQNQYRSALLKSTKSLRISSKERAKPLE